MIGSLSFPVGTTLPHLKMEPSIGSAIRPNETHAPEGNFSSVLMNVMSHAAHSLEQGEIAATAGIEGTVPVQVVVERVLAAERALQAAVAVRDKIVSSYLEISRMQI